MLQSKSASLKNQLQIGGLTSYPMMFKSSSKQANHGFGSQEKGIKGFMNQRKSNQMEINTLVQSNSSTVNIGGLTHSNFVMDQPTATHSNFKSKIVPGRYDDTDGSSALHMGKTHSNMYKTNFNKSTSQKFSKMKVNKLPLVNTKN